MADIYEKQGHYKKALEVYDRFLRMAPHDDYVRGKVGELGRKLDKQKERDKLVDPEAVERMEKIELFDRKIRFLNSLLEKL